MGFFSKLKKSARKSFKRAGSSARRGFKRAGKAIGTDVANIARGAIKDPKGALTAAYDTAQAAKGIVTGGRSAYQTGKAFGQIGKNLDKLSRKGGGKRTLEIGRLGAEAKSRARQKVGKWKDRAGAMEKDARSRYQEGRRKYQRFKTGGYGLKGKLAKRNFPDGRMGSPPAYAARRYYKSQTPRQNVGMARPRRPNVGSSYSGGRL